MLKYVFNIDIYAKYALCVHEFFYFQYIPVISGWNPVKINIRFPLNRNLITFLKIHFRFYNQTGYRMIEYGYLLPILRRP